MCDCFHLAFPNWQAATSGTAGRRLRAPEPGTEDDSTCDEPSQFTERPRPQGSSPVEEYPETEKYTDSDKECEAEHDRHHKSGSGKKSKKSGLGSMFEKRSTPKMSKLKEDHSPDSGVIVKTAPDGCSEGLVYGGGGREGIFIKEVVPESPASKSLKLKEGDQILSATVYFDNVSYEDAVQILEHAQAYKMKLCLKRNPGVTETESAIEPDVIPEEDVYVAEMREQGKTKRRSEARISWPKFPSFGKGRKSRFTRSHSSSEADEQRKLELSPTTSDTESPIKSQDTLKGKKKHKIKLSGLTKRGRISSSEDQDTDAPTSAQMLSHECLESPSGETPQVYVTEELKVVEDLRRDQELTEPQTVQHKVELITIASTLKTEDLTLAMAGQESLSGIKSPDGKKKKKKELSQLKINILGKDKSHKKDAKAKSSPKRLKTMGASIEIADQPENEKSDVFPSFESRTKLQGDQFALDANTQIIERSVPRVELEISDVAFIQKSPQKGEEKTKKGKDIKQKQDAKREPTFKLPKIGFSDIASEETIPKMNVNFEERTTKIEQLTTEGTEVKEDPFERLSKTSLSRTKLPKREDIEIPGMEDMSKRTTAKRIKEPKTVSTRHYEAIQAETVQMSIDVDSVKEAVSKLPGFKLPKVDSSGMPIPEEITVIDANAQRISVKTPTKTKHEAHFSKFDVTASPEISKTTIKLPKITPADLASEELFMVTQKDGDVTLPEAKVEVKVPVVELKEPSAKMEIKAPEIKVEAKGTEGSPSKFKMPTFKLPKFGVGAPNVSVELPDMDKDVKIEGADINIPDEGSAVDIAAPSIDIEGPSMDMKSTGAEQDGKGSKYKMPHLGFSMPKVKGPKMYSSLPKKDIDGKLPETKVDAKIPEIDLGKVDVSIPEAKMEVKKPVMEMQFVQTEDEHDRQEEKLKMAKFGIKMPKVKGPEFDMSLSKKDVEFKHPEAPKIDVSLGKSEVLIPEAKMEVQNPEMEIKPLQTGSELEGHRGKFQMPKFGITMPKVKGPEIDLSYSKQHVDVTLPGAKAEVELPEAPKIAVDMKPPECEAEIDGQGSKFKMPKFGISMPKVKGPELDLSSSKKDVDISLPEAEVNLPNVELKESSAKVEIKAPEIEAQLSSVKGSPSTFKLTTFKFPKFGATTPNVSTEVPDIDKEITIDGTDMHITVPHTDVDQPEVKAEVHLPVVHVKKPSGGVVIEQQPGVEVDAKLKKTRFSLPRFSFSKQSVKTPEVDASLQDVNAAIPEGNVEVELPEYEAEVEGSKFKMPKFGISMSKVTGDVTLPETKAEMKLPKVEVKQPEVEIKTPEIKIVTKDTEGSPSKFKMPTFKLPKFGVGSPSATIEVPDKDITIDGADVKIPEEVLAIDIVAPSIDIKSPSIDIKTTGTEHEGKGSMFKLPSLSFSGPQIKRPDIDLSLSKKDVDVTLPEARAEVKLPDVKLKESSAEVEIKAPEIKIATKGTEGSTSKLMMPTFKLPKFGVGTPSATIEVPDKDVKIDGADIEIPEEVLSVDIAAPSIDIKDPSFEHEGKGSKFKLPSLGFSGPQMKRPDIDLSLSKKDVDVTLPEAKADVKLPDVELKETSAKVEIKAPEIKITTKDKKGSPSKFKMPTFKLPKFGVGSPSATIEVPDKDITIDGADVKIPEEVLAIDIVAPSIDIKSPSIDIKTTGTEHEGKGSMFKLPSLSFSGPQIKRPDIDLSLSKKDVDVTLPEARAEVKLPDVKLKESSAEVEIKAPEIKIATKGTEGSTSKLMMPTFKLPKFGVGTPSATIEVPDKDVKIDGADIEIPEEVLSVDIAAPSIDIKDPSFEHEGKGSKFKLPSLGFSGPQMKRPDIDLSLSKKDVDVTLPEAKADVKLPDVELKETSAKVEIKAPEIKITTKDKKGSPSKFKMPTFKLPKFGVGSPSATIEVPDKDITIDGADVKIPEEVLAIDIVAPSIDIKSPSIDIKTTGTEHEGKGSMFKLPSLSFSGPQIKRPDIDLSLSKKDVDVTLPEARAEVKLPDVKLKESSAEVEIKAPEIKIATKSTEGSTSKLMMSTFKLPKFGVGTPSATIEVPDKDVKIDGADIEIPEEVLSVDIAAPSIDIKDPSFEHEGKGSKFKLPSLGFSGPQMKRPDIDLSLSKKDVDVTLPEAKADVKLPDVELKETSAKVEIKAPEIKITTKDKKGSPSKFKMPTFKLPKFGVGSPSATIEVPDKDITIDGADVKIPEEVLAIDIVAPSIDIKSPSIDIKTTGTEHEGKGSMFKLPSLSFSGPQIKRPDIDLSLSKKDVDVTLPEARAEVKLPDVKLKESSAEVEIKAPEIKIATKGTEGSTSKLMMPTFKLPKFGVGTPSATIEVPDKDVKIDGADIEIPEEVLSVDIAAPSIDIKDPSFEHEGKGSKFKLPSLGFSGPQMKRPDIDLSLSKKDVDVTLPEAKADVKLPDVELKETSAKVEIKAPEIKITTKDKKGSPSKFKMPTFKLPKFGVGSPSATIEVPDKDITIDGADVKIPEEVLAIDIVAPSIDIKSPSIDIKTTGTEHEGKGSMFKLPSLSFSGPQIKRPDIDLSLSKKDVDVTLPEARAEVKLPDVKLKESSAEVEIKAPEIKIATKGTEGSTSKLMMPTFKLPKFGVGTPSATIEVPDKDVKIDGADIEIPEEVLSVDIAAPSIDIKDPSFEHEGKGSKFKLPSLGFSGPQMKRPDIDLSLSKKDVDVTLPEAKADVKLPDVELKETSAKVEIKAPEIKITTKDKKGSPSKFKMPTFKLPKFGVGSPSATIEVPDKDITIDGADVKIPEEVLAIDIVAPSIDIKSPSIDIKTTGTEHEGKGSMFKLPSLSFSGPQIKRPDIDLSLSKKDVDVTLPEARAEVKLPDVKLKESSAEVEIKAPEIKIATKSTEGSTSKLMMSTFKLPKFGVGTPSATIEVPDKDVKIDGADIEIPEEVLSVDIAAPSIDIKDPSFEHEGKGSKFKLPSLGFSGPQMKRPDIDLSLSKKDVDVTLPEAKADVKLPDVELKETSAKVEIKAPEIKITTKDKKGSPSKFKMPTFKLPKFGVGSPSATIEVPDKDITIDGADVKIPEEVLAIDIVAPSIDIKSPSIDIKTTGTEHEGKGSMFKLPSLSFSGPQIKRPDIDLSLSKKDVDVTLPEARAEVKLPDVKLKESSAEVEIKAPEIKIATKGTEGSTSKLMMPTFKLPKFGVGTPSATIEVPDKDVKIDGADIEIPEEVLSVDIAAPSIDIKDPSFEHEGKGSKFKLPSLGFSGPQMKRPDIDLSLSKKDVDVTLPEAKADVKLPDVELKETSAKVEIKAPEIKITTKDKKGSPSKFKMPTFKLPKFGVGSPSATIEVPDKDITIDGADVKIPEEVLAIDIVAPSIDIKSPSIDIKTTGTEHEGKGSMFKLPSLSFSGPQIKRPDIDLSLSKKDVDVTLPEARAEVKLPDVKLKESSAEVEIKAPEIKIATKGTEGSTSKLMMPTFKLPKFGVGTPSATIEVPDKDVKIDGADIEIPEEVLSVDIAAPSIDIKDPSFEHEGKGSKFKLPSLGFSGPQMKRPDIDLSLSKKDVDVTLPEAKADVKLPDVELKETSAKVEIKAPEIKITTKDKKGSPSKFKMPTFKLPKFGVGSPSATIEVPDKDITIDGADVKIPEEVLAIDIVAPSIDIKSPSIDIKTTGTEHEGKGSMFKLPSLSFSGPQIKRPDIDLSLSKKDVDVTLPEARAEVKLPDVKLKESSAEVEIKAPEIKIATKGTEGSTSKLMMPTFKLPKFGVGTPSATIEVPDKDVKIDGADIEIPEEVLSVDIAAPSIDIKDPSFEHEGKGSKFKLPSLGFSGPQMKRPDIDLSLSKKDVDVTLPEAKADVKLPDVELKETSAKVEIKAPEIKITTKDKKGSPSKFKMPTFKLPKFGVGSPSATIEVPDKDITIDGADVKIPEEVLAIDIVAPSIDIKSPSIDIKTTGTEHEGKGSMFKLPSLSFSGPQIKRPDIDLSLSKKDVDVTLPEARAEVKLPDVKLKESSAEVEIKAPEIKIATKGKDGSPSKFKMPTFKLPKFGVGTRSATIEVPDKDVKIDGTDINIPEEVLAVDIAAPSIDIKSPSIDIKTSGTEQEGKESKVKFPSFSFSGPQIKRPEIDLSLSKKDVDVTLPEAKAEVKLPDVELKETSAEVEIKAAEIKIATKGTEGSPSKFKMPTFKLPKFGVGTPSATIEVPDMEGDVKIDGPDIQFPEEVLSVDIAAPNIDIKEPSFEHEGKGSKFKLPSLGFSGPQMKRPDIDLSLSKKDVDVTRPEAKADVKLPDVELKETSAKVEIKAPEIKITTKDKEGSPSKFKMPTFKLPKFGVGSPSATIEVPDKDVKINGADIKIPEEVLAVDIAAPSIDIKSPSIDIKTTGTEHEGKGSMFKLPSLSFSGPQIKRPDIDLSLSKKDVDVTLPEARADVKLPDVKLKEPSAEVEIKAPEIKIATKGKDGSPSKFKMPTFKLPKFGVGSPSATIEVPDKDVTINGVDIEIPEEVLAVDIAAPSIDIKSPSIDIKTTGTEQEGKESKFKFPSFSFSGPQIKRPEIDLSLSQKDVDVTLPQAKAEVKLPDVELKETSAEVEIKAPEIKITTKDKEGSPSKFKMPTFKLPKFGVGSPSATIEVPDKDITIDGVDIEIPEEVLAVDIAAPSIDIESPSIDIKTTGTEHEGKGSMFKLPSLSFSGPQIKRPDIDLSLSKKDVEVTLPEARAEVKLPDVKLKESSAQVEIKGPEIEAQTGNVEGSPSKLKMPTFTLPKFGAATPKVSVEGPDVDKDIQIEGATVDVTAPSIDTEGLSVDMKAKGSELEVSGSKFKRPKFGISMPKVKGPEIDLSLSKKDVDVTLPDAKAEVKLPSVEVKEHEAVISAPDAPTVEVETKKKRPNWTFSKLSFSSTGGKAPYVDVKLETPKVDVTPTKATAEVQGPPGVILIEEPPAAKPDANVKKTKFSRPRFSFSKSSVKEPEVSAELLCVDVSLSEGQVTVKQPEMQIKAPELEAELDGQGSKFKFPKFGIALPTVKGPGDDLNASQEDAGITLPEVKAEVKLPLIKVKEPSAHVEIKASETEAKSKDAGGSPLKLKMPTLKMPKFGAATYDVTVEAPDADKVAETDGAKLKEDVTVNIKGPSVAIKSGVSQAAITDSETPKTDTDAVGLGSPSKFQLPSFTMPKMSFSRPNPEDEHVPVDTESKADKQEMKVEPKEESKSPKVTFTSFGEILKSIDVEFDVPKTSENLENSKEVHETDEASGEQLQAREKETKQDATRSPERTGWFKFPKFGLSSPSEPAKVPERDERKDEKSPAGETVDEEISPTCSVQSSDAFADISSAMTSEYGGFSVSSPTRVTVKYSDPIAAAGLGELHSNIITSTTKTELISVEPNLPEKITILSSGVSSSSEDTLRLESRKIHLITSNIQATPEAQHAKLLTAVQIQSAGGFPQGPEANEAASWTIEDSQSGKTTVFEKHFVRETSSERSESKETIVITKQITRRFDSSEPISGETASSIQRLRDSMHSDKMRFFDGADE
ncbi:uncharacterized protein PEZ65_013185 [Lycodopsis pacificus]